MIIDAITKAYEGRIKLQEPLKLKKIDLPDELSNILIKTNGIMEIMILPSRNEPINISWIIYPYDEMLRATEYYKNEYGIKGIVFSSDGAGNPYYLMDGKVYEFNAIYDESELKAESLAIFFDMIS